MATAADLFSGGTAKVTSGSTLVTGYVARAAQAVFYGCDGRNTSTANVVYIWIADCASVGAITASNVVHVIGVPTSSATGPNGGNFSFQADNFGELFLNGIVIAGSSTDFPTFTLMNPAALFINTDVSAEYGMY